MLLDSVDKNVKFLNIVVLDGFFKAVVVWHVCPLAQDQMRFVHICKDLNASLMGKAIGTYMHAYTCQ